MTWYTGMCGIIAMGLLYGLALWSMCACVGALDLMTLDQWMVTIGRTSLVMWACNDPNFINMIYDVLI
jgi:hypothetical protein